MTKSRTNDMRRIGCMLLGAALTAMAPATVRAAQDSEPARSTAEGVFTAEQAKAGADIYAGICTGCHTVSSHTGVDFRKSWMGMPVSEMFLYIRDSMPEDAPGSLSAEEYIRVIAYLLELNGMPAGETALPTDEAALRKIRIDTAAVSGARSRPR